MYTLEAVKRDMNMKAKKLRKMDIIPGSISGGKLPENILIQMPSSQVKKFLKEKAKGAKVTLTCDGVEYSTILKDVTRAPMDGQVLDLSFQALTEGDTVTSVAQIVLTNKEKMTVPVHKLVSEIPHKALPEKLIEIIELDLGKLRPGDRVKVKDLDISKDADIEVLIDGETIVLNVDGHR